MCLTLEALAVFLNILGTDIVTTEPGVITINAETAPAVWVAAGDLWCTQAPQQEFATRIALLK